MNLSLASLSLKGLTGHWTKWGGNVHDVLGSQKEEFVEWVCQSCSRVLGKELTPYFYEHPEGEFIRVCAICVANDCKELKERITYIEINVIKTSFDEFNS